MIKNVFYLPVLLFANKVLKFAPMEFPRFDSPKTGHGHLLASLFVIQRENSNGFPPEAQLGDR